jgi:hypothetical protein
MERMGFARKKKNKNIFINACRYKIVVYLCNVNKAKQLKNSTMKNVWESKTGMTRTEVEALYIETIDILRELGATEEMAREIAQETLRETLGL